MRILLVQPKKPDITVGGDDFAIFEPLALEYVAAGVEKDHEVRIIDQRLEDRVEETLQQFDPQVVGITAYTVHVNQVHRLMRRIKERNPGIFTVVGGHHATVAHQDFLAEHIDMVVLGEGTARFAEIVRRLDRGQDTDGIEGTAYLRDGKAVHHPEAADYELDDAPFPARHLTRKYRKRYASEWMRPLASLRTSKGCPFKCTYCSLWTLTRRYLVRDPEKIVEELHTIEEPYVFLADDESFIRADHMTELADRIAASGIRKGYYAYVRADTVVRNPELIARWKQVGLRRVAIGFEFMRDSDLRAVNKGSTVEKNMEAARIVRRTGIDLFAGFMIRPDFEKADFEEMGRALRRQPLEVTGLAVMTPLPGTRFFDQVKDQPMVRNYDYYDFYHTILPTRMPIADFYREWVKLYARAAVLSRQLRHLLRYRLRDLPGLFWRLFKLNRRLRKLARDYADSAIFALRDARQPGDALGPNARLLPIAPALPAPSAVVGDKRLPLPAASSSAFC